MREAPSIVLINKLLQIGAKGSAYDPVATEEAKHIIGDKIEYADDKFNTLVDADALLLVTEWNEFRVLNYDIMRKLMREHVVFDGRNIYEHSEMKENGFKYFGIGR